MAPVKAPHLAIEVARQAGLPLKLAGEIQPIFRDYWRTMVEPHIDGRTVEFVGEASLDVKNDLLANASALLFPIQWHEPFGLVMIEAMACGTPVIALPGGAVAEVVSEGVSGWICGGLDRDGGARQRSRHPARACRRYVEQRFSRRAHGSRLRVALRVVHRPRRGRRRIPLRAHDAKDGP